MKNKIIHWFVIGIFILLYFVVSIISTIHVIDFFEITNPFWLAVLLAIGFELGAAASLASLSILDKINRPIVWTLFIVLTLFQSMGNMYYAYVNIDNYQGWIELFGLTDESVILQKRILAIVSGAILPLVALGYIKSLVDYIKPNKENKVKKTDILNEFLKEDSTKKSVDVKQEKLESDKKTKIDNIYKEYENLNKQFRKFIDKNKENKENSNKNSWPIKTTKINPKN